MSKVQTRRSLSLRGSTYNSLADRACLLNSSPAAIVEALIARHLLDPNLAPRPKLNAAKAERIPAVSLLDEEDDVITLPRRYPMHELDPGALPVRVYKHVPRFDSETPGPKPQAGGDRSAAEKAASLAKIKEAARKMGKGRIGGGF